VQACAGFIHHDDLGRADDASCNFDHAPIACCEGAAHQMGSIREADVAQSGAQFAFDKLRDVQTPRRLPSTFDENETSTEFPNAGRT
jgi:hypothetical protein